MSTLDLPPAGKQWLRHLVLLAVFILLALSAISTPIQAAGTVTDCSAYDDGDTDDGADTLGEALAEGPGLITFSCSGTIIVPQITINNSVTIDASGQSVVLDANFSNRIFNVESSGNLTLISLTLQRGRVVLASGGGIYNNGGMVTISNSTIKINSAESGSGSGIYNNGGTITISNSALDTNNGTGDGEGDSIWNNGTITVTNVRFFDFGNPIYNAGGTATITNSTIRSALGGIVSAGGTVHLRNSIVVGTCSGSIDHGGYPNYGCGGSVTGDLRMPESLRGNPQYQPILPGSVAIDAGDNSICPPTDQRGAPRPIDGNEDGTATCDLGSYELGEAHHLEFRFQPVDTSAGAIIFPPVIVDVVDHGNETITQDNSTQITLALGNDPAGATLSGTLTATVSNGTAIFNDLRIDQPGTGYTLVASATGLGGATSNAFNIIEMNCPAFPRTVPAGDVGDLINAIQCANAIGSNDVINLTNSTYTLDGNSSLPDILPTTVSGALTINGNGATIMRDNASPQFRIFTILGGGDLSLNGVTISGGNATHGGGIYNDGTLTINSSTISGNESSNGFGGGIYNNGILTINDSTVNGNDASYVGGGIYINIGGTAIINNTTINGNETFTFGSCGGGIINAGTMTISNSTISGNMAHGGSNCGGGIVNNGGTLTISNSTFSGNSADGDFSSGGGIRNDDGTLTISNSTFSGNSAHGASGIGGGILNAGMMTISNSTFSGNSATNGGGIATFSEEMATISNSTFSGNSATNGGGIYNGETLQLRNSIVYNNTGGDCYGIIDHGGYPNLGCDGSVTGDPRLDTFNDSYYPLLPGSAAIDAGDNTICANPPVNNVDQIGMPRPFNGGLGAICDLGAIEAQFTMPTLNVNDVMQAEGDSGTTIFTFTVSLTSPALTGGVTFDIATSDGSATTGDNDYVTNSVSGSIPEGESTYSFDVTVNGDTQPESDETFIVTMSNIGGAFEGVVQGTGTITDDDTPGVTVTPITGLQTTEAGGTASFNIRLHSQPAEDITINLSSSDPTEGTVPASVTIPAANWQTGVDVTVTGVDDDLADGNVAYTIVTDPISSSDPNYDGIDPDDVEMSNLDDDTPGVTLTPTTGLVTTETGGTATFDVVLNSEPAAEVTIELSSSNSSEGTVAPATLTFTDLDWNVAQTVTVTGVDDVVIDGDIAYTIVTTLSSTDPDYAAIDPADVEVINLDDDTAEVIITPTSLTGAEGSSLSYQIQLDSVPSGAVTVQINFDPSQVSVNGSDTSPVALAISDNAPHTVTVLVVQNANENEDRTTLISHAILSSAAPEYPVSMALLDVTVTIEDVPPPPPTPLCEDHNFAEGGVVRASTVDGIDYAVNCRVLYQNGQPTQWLGGDLYNAGAIGIQGVLDLGVQQAVDIFSPVGMNYFNGGAVFCLRGSGTLIWLAAKNAPRVAEIIGSYTVDEFPGFTCSTLFEPGTLVLVRDNPIQ